MTNIQFWQGAYIISLKFPGQFRAGFVDWLYDNVALQRTFESEALKIVSTGRQHYSAYTIIEYMRHHTLLTSKLDEFKINQAWTSSMARLFAHMNPNCHDFFEYRVRPRDAVVGALVLV